MTYSLVLQATAFHSTGPESFEILENRLFCINRDGTIGAVLAPGDPACGPCLDGAKRAGIFTRLGKGQFLLPGFIDTHVHAPQWAQVGKALDTNLPVWLKNYTFPLEAAYKNLDFAQEIYTDLVDTLTANGTTTAQYFGSVHPAPNKLLADICAAKGQRAFIGKVVMDLPDQCPDYYRDESAETALADTEEFLRYCAELNRTVPQDIVGVITPRFIPACSDKALRGLGALAAEHGAPVQSHCSEGDWEHAFVMARTGLRDTKAHLRYGLLTQRTTLAHSVYLNDDDAVLYKKYGANIAHSPLSNIFFAGSVCPVRRRLDQGVIVSLATDISAGYTPSMFDAMRQAVLSSRILTSGTDPAVPAARRGSPGAAIDFRHAFYMATLGGATALRIKAGQFKKGNAFDAFVFDCNAPYSNSRCYESDTLTDMLQKIIFTGQRQNITALWIQGKPVTLH